MMTYDEAVSFIKEISKSGSILGLENIENLMNELGNVENELNIIHIAGTNGKGSVGAYLESVFMECGFSVARYCSPAVFTPLEIMTYNRINISKDEYADVVSQVKRACDIMVSGNMSMPTAFEVETAAAFVWFASKKPDIVLLETGMGGIEDATNVIKSPMASVITTISKDHMKFLGDTVEEIAKAKAGIIKPDSMVFCAYQKKSVLNVISDKAKKCNCEFYSVELEKEKLIDISPGKLVFEYPVEGENVKFETKMSGEYQIHNASLAALITSKILINKYGFTKSDTIKHIKKGIENASWPGRFETISKTPLVIIDGAHNEGAAIELKATLEKSFTNTKLTYIIGVLADKEHEKMLKLLLPLADKVFTITPSNIRGLSGEKLKEEALRYHNNVEYCENVRQAVDKAILTGNTVIAFGSLSYLGELKQIVKSNIIQKDRK